MQPSAKDEIYHPPPRPPRPPRPPPPTVPPPLYTNAQVYFPTNAPNSVHANRRQHPSLPVPWSTGLFDCCDDVNNCCVTCFCPCITFGQIAEIVDRGSIPCGASGALYALLFCVTGCACLYSCFYRSKMRGQLLLEEAPCVDCVAHCCCESCALCQEYRELRARGFSLHYGWQRNMEMQSIACTLPPAVQGGMQR